MSDSDSDPAEELFETPQLVLETFKTSRLQKNPRLEHFKNIIRQNQGKHYKIPLPDLEFYQEQILAQIPRGRNHEKKSQGVCQNPRVEKKSGEMIMKFSTTSQATTEMIMSTLKISLLMTSSIFP